MHPCHLNPHNSTASKVLLWTPGSFNAFLIMLGICKNSVFLVFRWWQKYESCIGAKCKGGLVHVGNMTWGRVLYFLFLKFLKTERDVSFLPCYKRGTPNNFCIPMRNRTLDLQNTRSVTLPLNHRDPLIS